IDDRAALASLHNPACATGIRAAPAVLPDDPHVAVVDTAFHRDAPARAATYAISAAWLDAWCVRRYGFLTISHAYVSRRTADLLALAGAADVREGTTRADSGDDAARRALDVYCYRIRGYVGAYCAALGRLDAIAFTAGVGENSAAVRAGSLAGLERLGIAVDDELNRRGHGERVISPA